MGTPMNLPAFLAASRAPPASPLLAFLAGSHAEVIACLWPAPHEDFFALPSARRHAAAVLAGRSGSTLARIQWMAARAKDGELAAELFGRDPPGGLMKAFARMGEVLWPAEAYVRFLDLFGEEAACGLIRHIKVLRPDMLATIAALPGPLRQASIVTHLGTDEAAAADLVAAWETGLRIRGPASARDAAQRLGRAASSKALFEMARDVIQPQAFGTAGPLPVLPAPFIPVQHLDALANTAHEFRNCLRDFVAELAAGRMAVYVWRGAGGPAAVALRFDPSGWRLAEARGRDNADLGDEALMAIVAGVQSAGVRTGEAWNALQRRLDERCYEAQTSATGDTSPAGWRSRLCLGNLWE